MRFLFLLLIFPLVSHAEDLVNAVSLKNGARIISAAPSYTTSSPTTARIVNYSPHALIDESPAMWCSQSHQTSHLTFLFELSEDYDLEKFVFNNSCETKKGICTKKVKVEVSNVSAVAGFEVAGEYELDEYQVTAITFAHKKARWIKLIILSNYGNKEFTELTEFEAWGNFSNPNYTKTDIIGLWDTNFDWVSINSNQNGYIYGCYKWSTGSLYGGEIKRRVFTFSWKQKDDGQQGWCRLVINKEGNRLSGAWGFGNNYQQFGVWEFTKNSSTPKSCWNDEEVAARPSNQSDDKPRETLNVQFSLQDKESHQAVQGEATVEYKGEVTGTVASDDKGIATISLNKSNQYTVHVQAPSYMPYSFPLSFTETEKNEGKDLFKVIYLQRVEAGKTILLNNILFERGQYTLLPESHPELDKLVQLMETNPGMKIELAGHTDNVGDPKKNVELSEHRVREVKKYLVSKGIHADRIKTVGYGGSKPLYSNGLEENRKLNRRVEFKVLSL